MNQPSVQDNNQYECAQCHLVQELRGPHDHTVAPPPCPRCGCQRFLQITVTIVCDFCSMPYESPMQFWTYPAEDFTYTIQFHDVPTQHSHGEWLACEICHELISIDDRAGLAQRSVEKDLERNPEYRGHQAQLLALGRQMHEDFFNHRTGDPRPEILDGPVNLDGKQDDDAPA